MNRLYKTDYSSLNTFDTARQSVLDMLKKFYPNDYKNFENGRSGGMILDAFAFIGEVLHFTQGQYFNQAFPQTVTDRQKAANLAQWYGMKNIGATLPWVTIKATITVSAIGGAIQSNMIPKILPGATVYAGNSSIPNFILASKIDFTKVPMENWTKYYNGDGSLKKVDIPAYGYVTSYSQYTTNHTITTSNGSAFERFYEIELAKENVQQIIEVKDQNGNAYYEVDHLVQDTVFNYTINENDVQDNIPYLLFDINAKYRFLRKQFVSASDEKVYTKLIFGNTSESEYQEKLFNINPHDVVLPASLMGVDNYSAQISQLNNRNYDPENMLLIDSLGVGPSNGDVLTIKYVAGDSIGIKVPAGSLNRIKNVTWSWNDSTLQADIISSLTINNNEPSAGGRDALTTEEIKQYTVAYGLNQKRAVTQADYAGMILSMPEYLGRPDKVYTTRATSNNDPYRLDIFMLSVDWTNNFFDPTKNPAFISNMRLYLKKYKCLNDFIVLRSGKVLNIILEVDLQVNKDYHSSQVAFNVATLIKQYFSKEKWDFGKHLYVDDLLTYIKLNVMGIVSIGNVKIRRPSATDNRTYPYNYSNQEIDFNYRQNKWIVPADSILEIRYPETDIIINVDSTTQWT